MGQASQPVRGAVGRDLGGQARSPVPTERPAALDRRSAPGRPERHGQTNSWDQREAARAFWAAATPAPGSSLNPASSSASSSADRAPITSKASQ